MRGLMLAATAAVTFTLGNATTTLVTAGLTASEASAQACFPVGQRVCAFKNGRWRNYRNRCYAQRANARPIRNGRCTAASNCASQGSRAVCGTWRGRRVNYRNLCYARRARATNIRLGRCQAGGGQACALYARQALSIVRAIRAKRCQVPGTIFYSSSANTHVQICRGRTPNQRAGVLRSMRGYLQRCRPQGGGTPGGGDAAKRRACNAYASNALAQRARYWSMGCSNDTSSTWSSSRAAHYNYCMRVGPGPAAGLTRQRAGQIQACGRN